MRKKFLNLFVAAVTLSAFTLLLFAQDTPVLDQGYAGATMVSGKVSPRQTPLTIYDTSYPSRKALGTSQSIDGRGNFAASINPPLILGHHIVVVDSTGTTSPAMVVAARPSSPSHQ